MLYYYILLHLLANLMKFNIFIGMLYYYILLHLLANLMKFHLFIWNVVLLYNIIAFTGKFDKMIQEEILLSNAMERVE